VELWMIFTVTIFLEKSNRAGISRTPYLSQNKVNAFLYFFDPNICSLNKHRCFSLSKWRSVSGHFYTTTFFGYRHLFFMVPPQAGLYHSLYVLFSMLLF